MIHRNVSFRRNAVAAALVSAGLIGGTSAARADQLSDLEAAVQKLQAQVAELKAQRAADEQKAAAAQAANAPAAAPAIVVNPAPVIPAATDVGNASALVPVPRLLQLKAAGGMFMVYGDFDEYVNHMRSSSGAKINALQDGAILRSRLGFTGSKDFGNGYGGAFTLETGLNATNGTQADQPNANTTTGLTTSGRLFDRQPGPA